MPFTADEIRFISESTKEYYVGIPQRKAARKQRRMWRKHADDLMGVPEANPFEDPFEPQEDY